jgi:hypothetical protein
VDVGLRVVELQEQQLRHDQVGALVGDRPLQEDDPVLQQAAVDVIGALLAAAALDDDRDQGHGCTPRPGARLWCIGRRGVSV